MNILDMFYPNMNGVSFIANMATKAMYNLHFLFVVKLG
jgi:hypothetical protein